MKKLSTAFILSLLLVFLNLFSSVIHSQGPTEFDRVYQEYSLKVESYRVAREDYILARSQYLRFQTLTSQNTAKEKTAAMLSARDDVLITYLKTVKERIEETQGIPDATRDAIYVRLDEDISWFSDHKGRISSAGSLDDLVSDSDEAKDRYKSSEPLYYEALSIISAGRVNHYRERLEDTFSSLADKVTQIREEERDEYSFSTRKLEIIDRWIFDTERRIVRSKEKKTEADNLIAAFPSLKAKGESDYNKVLQVLGEAQQYLKEASLFVKEIIREIKTKE